MKNHFTSLFQPALSGLQPARRHSLLHNSELWIIILGTTLGTYLLAFFMITYTTDRWNADFFSFWEIWDTKHYLAIAREGYSADGPNSMLIVFFPLYPLFIRLFYAVFHNWMLAALIVSNLAYGCAAVFLYKLVTIDYNHTTAIRSVFCFSIFPTAYFLHAGYTESLFLATVIASFYFARKGRWLTAALIGMLATATRLNGLVMLPALLLEYLEQRRFKISKDIGWLALVFLGILSYLLINRVVYGSCFAFLQKQAGVWTKSVALPWKGFFGHLQALFSTKSGKTGLNINFSEAFYGILGLIITVYATFKIRTSYVLYMWFTWILITATDYWLSMPRYTMSLFPIFIVFGILSRKRNFNYLYVFVAIAFYTFYFSRFLVGWDWAF